MNPVATEDSVLDVPPRSLWRALRDLAVSIVVVAAIALIVSFLSATSAHAQGKAGAARELRIGYQKSASLFVLQKAQGSLEKRLAPLGVGVKWVEFPAGPQLLEGLNVGAVDVGYVGEAPPIIMLSAMGEDTDRIVGLELGADDYLSKPCNPRELLARIRAILRRAEQRGSGDELGAACEFAGWRLDLVRRELRSPQGVVVNLSSGEFSLLRAFVERPQRVLTRDQLLDFARGPTSDAFDRAIDVQISRLRRKLDDGGGHDLIRTIRNEGYMFTPKVKRP